MFGTNGILVFSKAFLVPPQRMKQSNKCIYFLFLFKDFTTKAPCPCCIPEPLSVLYIIVSFSWGLVSAKETFYWGAMWGGAPKLKIMNRVLKNINILHQTKLKLCKQHGGDPGSSVFLQQLTEQNLPDAV